MITDDYDKISYQKETSRINGTVGKAINMTANIDTVYRRDLRADIAYDVAALANTYGGRIVIGSDGEGSSSVPEDAQITARKAREMITAYVCPDISGFFACGTETTEQGTVAVINVRRGIYRPYFIKEKGMTPQQYRREDRTE